MDQCDYCRRGVRGLCVVMEAESILRANIARAKIGWCDGGDRSP